MKETEVGVPDISPAIGALGWIYFALQITCIALFILGVPLTLKLRVNRATVFWQLLLATAAGWVLVNSCVLFSHLFVQEAIRAEMSCHRCGISDYLSPPYQLVNGVLCGAIYYVICEITVRLMMPRPANKTFTRHFILLCIGGLAAESSLLFGHFTRLPTNGLTEWSGFEMGPFLFWPIFLLPALVFASVGAWLIRRIASNG